MTADNQKKSLVGFSSRWWPVFFVAVVCVSLGSRTVSAGLTVTPATEVTISEYDPKDLSLIAQVHAARVFVDYERMGFFRIGLLPMLVIENVQVKIASAEYLTNALADLKSWHQPASGYRRLELRSLEITVTGGQQPRLRAAVAHLGPNGTIELSDIVARDVAGRQISLPKATLRIAGPSAGWLGWDSGGHQEELFICDTTKNKTP